MNDTFFVLYDHNTILISNVRLTPSLSNVKLVRLCERSGYWIRFFSLIFEAGNKYIVNCLTYSVYILGSIFVPAEIILTVLER